MRIHSKHSGFDHPRASEITPRAKYEQRRALLRLLAAGAGGAALASWAGREALAATRPGKLAALEGQRSAVAGAVTMEKPTEYQDATGYNNFYEFGTDKSDPARHAQRMKTRPWTVTVEGLVGKPRSFGIEELLKLGGMEEQIGRAHV